MSLCRPTREEVGQFIADGRNQSFTYAEVGATRGTLPSRGYSLDEYGTDLGEGVVCFERAAAALRRFANYPDGWCEVVSDGGSEPREGLTFVAQIQHFGFYSLNSCRVIYVIDEPAPARRYGFAFGTLSGHEECGEERFEVSLNPETGVVRYDVRAFSRPRSLLARVGAPLARMLQRRFWRDTRQAMRAAVG